MHLVGFICKNVTDCTFTGISQCIRWTSHHPAICLQLDWRRYAADAFPGLHTNSMEQASSWEADSSSAIQEIPPFPHFMETEVSLRCPQQPVTCPCRETNKFSPQNKSYLFQIHFNITLPSTPRSSYLNIHRELLDDFPLTSTVGLVFDQLQTFFLWS